MLKLGRFVLRNGERKKLVIKLLFNVTSLNYDNNH